MPERPRRRLPLPAGGAPERLREFVQHSVGAVVIVCGLFTLLGYMYFAGTADPAAHTRHVPMAVVDLDEGATLDTPAGARELHLGRDIVGGLIDHNDWSRLDLHVVSADDAEAGLRDGRFFGVVTIPSDFSRDLGGLVDGAAGKGEPVPPAVITVASSPRLSVSGSMVAQRLVDALQGSTDSVMGPKLLENARTLADARRSGEVSAASATALSHPVRVQATVWDALPEGMSNPTLPMFYALVVVLAGFTGAMIISNLLDSRLGFMPIEVGPLSVNVEVTEHGRLLVLVRKWLVTLITAPLVAGIYLAIAHALGIGGFSYVHAYLFSVLGIIAVGICSHAVIAAMGSLGMLVNLVVFVILGIPTSGGATPPEMLPGFFRAIGTVEPMHQAYVGLRAIMFFDSSGAAGLTQGVWALGAWLLAGLVGGVAVATLYDRLGMTRQRLGERVDPDLRKAVREHKAAQAGVAPAE